jgi:Raf kinase inhibitor-like YbhB/YbcL family protein
MPEGRRTNPFQSLLKLNPLRGGDGERRRVMSRSRIISTAFFILLIAILVIPAFSEEGKFTLTSPDIPKKANMKDAQVFSGFGCSGQNISPALAWKNFPPETKSFALMVHDPDAPTGSGWWHWVVYNIPPKVSSLPAGAGKADGSLLPQGAVQSNTDFGGPGYGGPCPPKGDKPHRYVFTVFALKVDKLDLPPNASGALVGFVVRQNAIGKASLTGYYGRAK